MILYLISGRSFYSKVLGRKISEVVNVFSRIDKVELLCGGDIPNEIKTEDIPDKKIVTAQYAYRYQAGFLKSFLSRSVSELRDILHNYQTYKYLSRKNGEYKLIWERSSRLHRAGIRFAKRNNIPCILEWKDHLIDYKWSLFRWYALYIERWKNKNADFITVESEVLKKNLISQGIDKKKILVTYNAVNPDEFRKDIEKRRIVRESLKLVDEDVLIGYVGSYAFYHDSIRMLKAAKLLRDKGYRNIKWLLIGDGKDKKNCEIYARENDLLNKVVFMLPFQPKEEIPKYLSAMDVTILPGSTDIICPIKVMEYMAAESVVMVPNYECNREIINDSNGLMFEPENEDSIVRVLKRVSDQPEICSQLGRNARQTVLDNLTWDKTYGKVLKQILSDIL